MFDTKNCPLVSLP